MINFPCSTFTWKSHPHTPDPYYKYSGGFVGKPGQAYQVRFNLEAKCEIHDEASGCVAELFVGAPCRTEYTIARRNLFQVPSAEFRFAFSRDRRLGIARRPSSEKEEVRVAEHAGHFLDHEIDVRTFPASDELSDAGGIVRATLAKDLLNARSTYRDSKSGLTVSVEYPVNLINTNEADGEFQICTGPVIVPDLDTWDGRDVERVFLAHVAVTAFDWVEFILRREVEAAESEKAWLDKPRGRDRQELLDPDNEPPGYSPMRPRPLVYNEIWEFEATNVVLRADNP